MLGRMYSDERDDQVNNADGVHAKYTKIQKAANVGFNHNHTLLL